MPFSLLSIFIAYSYEKKTDVQNKLKEIEQFYKERKDVDSNTISFSYTFIHSA